MTRSLCRRGVLAAVALLAVRSTAEAQDCTSAPLLGRRAAVGAQLAHSDAGETGVGGLLAARLAGPVRLDGAYLATRLDDVHDLAQQGRLGLSVAASGAGFDLCPTASVGYRRLATAVGSTSGHVGTRELRLGASLGRPFAVTGAVRMTPFIEPAVVSRSTTWESVDSWRVEGREDDQETQLWFGISAAVSRGAVVARYLPSRGTHPQELSIAIITAFGRR